MVKIQVDIILQQKLISAVILRKLHKYHTQLKVLRMWYPLSEPIGTISRVCLSVYPHHVIR